MKEEIDWVSNQKTFPGYESGWWRQSVAFWSADAQVAWTMHFDWAAFTRLHSHSQSRRGEEISAAYRERPQIPRGWRVLGECEDMNGEEKGRTESPGI